MCIRDRPSMQWPDERWCECWFLYRQVPTKSQSSEWRNQKGKGDWEKRRRENTVCYHCNRLLRKTFRFRRVKREEKRREREREGGRRSNTDASILYLCLCLCSFFSLLSFTAPDKWNYRKFICFKISSWKREKCESKVKNKFIYLNSPFMGIDLTPKEFECNEMLRAHGI